MRIQLSGDELLASQNVTGEQIVAYAKRFIGKCTYKLGCQNPNKQCDCSGFIWYVYHHFFPNMFALRTDARGYAKYGKKISKTKLAVGDIVIMHTGWRGTQFSDPDHVGIYMGNGKIIQVGHNSSQNGCYVILYKNVSGIILYGRRIVKKNSTVKKYKVLCDMNVRQSNSVASKKIGLAKEGTILKSSKQSGNWAYFPSLSGWICIKGTSEQYLKQL